ncbi:hypothetical protein DFQ26_002913 [Actinomortierella ambigua]|nr:hypothetical protein DFQ26_002913 [Actinomortierella ambigua]
MFQRPATTQTISYVLRKDKNSNGHLLGVNALAFDSATPTTPHGTPGGILYTGGRDGMIAAWDVHLEASRSPVDRGIPGEERSPKGLPPSTFRQSFNHHTDWVNDIVLCHDGGSLLSASSDRTVKLVRPHSDAYSTPHLIGTHGDYVKTLAYAHKPGWIASGGLDRVVNIWDLNESRSDPIGTIPETSSKASIYALACNHTGSILATGSPEKVIRVWDPRSGKRITKFTGHTDNIRALLVSESGDTILSASSDTTIKLWSLTAQRCITTFTMYADSVWSLYSDHPRLETFYSGSKDGLVTKTEICRGGGGGGNADDDDGDSGECIVLCKADAGVARIVAHDDARLWTATSSSSVCQWPDIPRKQARAEELQSSIVPANLLKLNLSESSYMEPTVHEQFYPTSTVYSAASFTSYMVAGHQRDRQSQHSSEDDEGLILPLFSEPENVIEGEHGLVKHVLLNNRRMVVTEDKCGEIALWDLIRCVQLKTFRRGDDGSGGRKLEEVVNELNTNESVPTWCTVDTRIGALTVHLEEGRCFDAEVYADEVDPHPTVERPEDQRIIVGKWVLRNLFRHYVPAHIEAYEKEVKRQERQLEELQQHQQQLQQQQPQRRLTPTPPPPTSSLSTTTTTSTTTSTTTIPTTVITNEKNEVVAPQVYQPQAIHGRPSTINTTLANSVYSGASCSSVGNASAPNSRSTTPRSAVLGAEGTGATMLSDGGSETGSTSAATSAATTVASGTTEATATTATTTTTTAAAAGDTQSPSSSRHHPLSQPTTPALSSLNERSLLGGSPSVHSVPSTPTGGVFSPTSPSTAGSGSKDKEKDKEKDREKDKEKDKDKDKDKESSNGFMGRLRHSVKRLARTPSAEQRFDNGRPATSPPPTSSSSSSSATTGRKASASISAGSGGGVGALPGIFASALQPPMLSMSTYNTNSNSSATTTPTPTATTTTSAATTANLHSSTTAAVGLGVQGGHGGSTRSVTPTTSSSLPGESSTVAGRGGDDDSQTSSLTPESVSAAAAAATVAAAAAAAEEEAAVAAAAAAAAVTTTAAAKGVAWIEAQRPVGNTVMPLRAPHPPFTPPTDFDCPSTTIPEHIPVILSEQSREASSSVDLYRGSVGGMKADYLNLVPLMPNWALEALLKNTIPAKDTIKVSFVLRPYRPVAGGSVAGGATTVSASAEGELLGELPGGNPRLTAPRMLRIRKVLAHIVEKLELSGPQEGTVIPAPFDPLASVPALPSAANDTEQQQTPTTASPSDETPTHGQTRALDPVKEEEPGDLRSLDPIKEGGGAAQGSSPSSPSRASLPTPSSSSTGGTSTPTDEEATAAAMAAVRAAEAEQRRLEAENKRRLDLLRPENWLEVLCNDQVLSPTTSLMSAKAFYWKAGGDLVLHYRYKASASV